MKKDEFDMTEEEKEIYKRSKYNGVLFYAPLDEKLTYIPDEKIIKLPDVKDQMNIIDEWCAHEYKLPAIKYIADTTADVVEKIHLQNLLNTYKMGFFLKVAFKDNIASFDSNKCQGTSYEDCRPKMKKVCKWIEKCKTKDIKIYPLQRLTRSQKETCMAYNTYVNIIVEQGRKINDIIDIDPKFIKVLGRLDPDKFDLFIEFEKTILKHRKSIGVNVLSNMILIINSGTNISVEDAYAQVKSEYDSNLKQKREQKRNDLLTLWDVNKIKDENENLKKERDDYKNKYDELEQKFNEVLSMQEKMQEQINELTKQLNAQARIHDNTNEPKRNDNTDNAVISNTVTNDEKSEPKIVKTPMVNDIQQSQKSPKKVNLKTLGGL